MLDKTKARSVADHSETRLRALADGFARARDLADAGDVEAADKAMSQLKDQLLGFLDGLNLAGVRGAAESIGGGDHDLYPFDDDRSPYDGLDRVAVLDN